MPNDNYTKLYTFNKSLDVIYKSVDAVSLEKLNSNLLDDIKEHLSSSKESFFSFSKVINIGPNNAPKTFSVIDKSDEIDVYYSYDFKHGFSRVNRAMTIINIGFIDYDSNNKLVKRIYFHGKNIFIDKPIEAILEDNILEIKEEDFKEFKEAFIAFTKNEFDDVVYFRTSYFTGKMRWYCFENIEPSIENPNLLHGCIRDIDKFTVEKNKNIEKTHKDTLTGLLNNYGIASYVNNLLKSAPTDIYFLGKVNIDGFSELNNSYGRIFGDNVIKTVAKVIEKLLSPYGKVARIGADEFLFIDKYKTDDQMEIRPFLRNLKMELNYIKILDVENVNISTTTGVVSYPKDGNNYEVLSEALSKALYRGKMKGGSCYIIYQYEKHGDIDINEKKYKNTRNGIKFNNNQYISDAINKLINSDNVHKTINHILQDVCEHFIVDRIVLADNLGNIMAQATTNDNVKLEKFYPIAYDDEYMIQFNKDNIRFNNFIDVTDIGYGLPYLRQCGVKAFIQIKFIDDGEFLGYISFEDLSARRVWSSADITFVNTLSKIISAFYLKHQTEVKLNETLYVDPLTGYNNINKFKELASNLEILDNSKVFLNIDIKKFTRINDSHGFSVGDEILKVVSDSINDFLNEGELFCRIADDKFIIIINYEGIQALNTRLDILFKILSRKTSFVASEAVEFTCGAYIAHEDDSIANMIDKSNYARKTAKSCNKQYLLYDDELLEEEKNNRYLEQRMYKAIENEEFVVYFQPCYYIKTKKVCSMEALVRWNMDGVLVPPGKFVPLFEKNGFITKVDFYVYETVCKTIKKYGDLGYDVPTISINVSRRHIENPNFVSDLNALLDKYDVPRSNIGVELTESLFIDNEDVMISFVEKLHNEGYRIYMDDFGVAYSTLSLLGRMHVDVIKLDKSFIDDTAYNPNETIIISNIIRMAKELGIRVLSEGIETEIQLDQLSKMKCDYAQGYWFAKPKPISEFSLYLEEKKKNKKKI